MGKNYLALAAELKAQGKPFVLATVVRREAPISARLGDKAVITPDGGFVGWVGGSCAKPTVVREALKAFQDGQPRLIVLTPRPEEEKRPGLEVFLMSCHSGGTVEIYIEPHLAVPSLLIMGASPIAEALARLGGVLGYGVFVMDPAATPVAFPDAEHVAGEFHVPVIERRGATYAVVATMGHFDEEALQAALACKPQYLGMVASRKKFSELVRYLEKQGISPDSLRKVKNPAGLDINAKYPEEVALSILAEIIQVRQSTVGSVEQAAPVPLAGDAAGLLAKDPICGMMVETASAQYVTEYEGARFYFCCAHCKDSFEGNPEKHLVGTGTRDT
jgi:xanthine dehydrogenase accessory factor